MRITDPLRVEGIRIGGAPASKDEAIDQLVDLMAAEGNVVDRAGYAAAVREREAQFSTGLGDGIAIPHAKTSAVSAPGLAAMTVPAGVDYDSADGEPATLLFLIAAPEGEADTHLEVLSRLSTLLLDARGVPPARRRARGGTPRGTGALLARRGLPCARLKTSRERGSHGRRQPADACGGERGARARRRGHHGDERVGPHPGPARL